MRHPLEATIREAYAAFGRGDVDGFFHEDVEDVLANDDHAVVLARHLFTRSGSSMDYRTAHVYEVREGKLSRCYEQPRDAAAFHNAWGSSPH